MYILKPHFILFDAFDLTIPKVYLSDTINHYTYIMDSETRIAFKSILNNDNDADANYEVFKEYGFFIKK